VNVAPFGDGGLGPDANIGTVYSVTVAPDGKVYIPDTSHYRIRVIDPDTTVITTWLNSTYNLGGGCQTGTVSLYLTEFGSAIRFDESGGAYISGYICQGTTTNNTRGILHRTSAGVTTRVLGLYNGVTTENADAVATLVPDLSDFILDSNGDLVVAMYANHRIRKVTTSTGKINTIAGDGTAGYAQPADVSPDPGAYVPATGVRVNYPNRVAEWPGGHLLIADRNNYAVRMIW
jgi:hypothetical protein